MTDLYVRSLVLAALGLLALVATRGRSASVRHLVTLAGLASMTVLPLLSGVLPPARLSVLPPPPVERTTVPFTVRLEPAPATIPPATPEPAASSRPFPWPLLWPLGTLILLLRWAFGWAWLAVRLRRTMPLREFESAVPVVESDAFGVPLVAWTPHARIVLPRGWREWSADRLDVVLRHETAHVRRGDGVGLLVARLAVALFWPNPFVWLVARAEARLAERATDDLVVVEGVPPARYAHELLALARNAPASSLLPALGMARKAQLSHRVEMILRNDLPRTSASRRARLGAVLAALTLTLPVAAGALVPQAIPTSKASPMSVAVTAVANPIAFRLRCKIVRADNLSAPSSKGSPTEPQIGQSDPANVVNAPDLYTGGGIPAALKVTLDRVVHTVELRPDTGDDFRCVLQIGQSTPYKGTRMGYNNVWYQAHPNEWVRYPILDDLSKPTGYQMLVQVTPYKGEGPASSVSATSGTPSKGAPQAIHAAMGSQRTGNLIAGTAPQQILLRCKIVQTADVEPIAIVASKAESALTPKADVRVVTSPILRTLDGERRSSTQWRTTRSMARS